ncbi:MAG: hypothetical protein WCC00_07510, partial [Candidatus Aminicenantales bacterium]
EAQKRIEAVNQEFAQVRGFLEEHKAIMAELQTTEEHLRGEIRGHFDRAVNYQKMMANAAVLAGDELEKIGGLNEELENVRVKAEAEYAALKKQLSGYAGIIAQLPAPVVRTEEDLDWTKEIGKLRKVRDLLATLRQAEPSEAGDASPDGAAAMDNETTVPEAEAAEELAASLGLMDDEEDGTRDDVEFAKSDTGWGEIPGLGADLPAASTAPAADPAEEPAGFAAGAVPEAEAGPEASAALESLARYRKTEPVNNGIELAFFTTETAAFLDADAFMSAVGKIVDGASGLHSQLTQTTSVKDLFLLKQEILNQQEVLRKLVFRIVRFCDKEGGRLPGSLDEIIGSRGLKDVVERLTMANWSDPSDFRPFMNELKAMKRAFDIRTGTTSHYIQSVLDEVEGREN